MYLVLQTMPADGFVHTRLRELVIDDADQCVNPILRAGPGVDFAVNSTCRQNARQFRIMINCPRTRVHDMHCHH